MSKILIIAAPELCKDDFLSRIDRLCKAGADAILLRAKHLNEADFAALAINVKQICDAYKREFIINYFFDVACELKSSFWLTSAQAANLSALNLQALKTKIYAPAHDLAQAKISRDFTDVFVASHIFPTACKEKQTPKGIELISDLKRYFSQEIYALGGVNEQNFGSVIAAGANGICLMSSAMSCENESDFIARFRRKF